VLLLVATAVHGAAQAAVALAAAGCARALSGDSEGVRMGAGALAGRGLLALGVRAASHVVASHVQARLSAHVGDVLRIRVLDGWLDRRRLRGPRHLDQGAPTECAASDDAAALGGLTAGVHEVERGVSAGLVGSARALAQIAPLAVVLLVLDAHIAAVALLVLGGFGLLLGKLRGRLRRAHREGRERANALLEAADEAVRHADLWRSYGAESRARDRVHTLGKAAGAQSARVEAQGAALSGMNEVLGGVALVLAVGAARAGWLGGLAEGARLLPFVVTFFLLYRPLRDLTEASGALDKARAALATLEPLLGSEPAPTEPARTFALAPLEARGLLLPHGAARAPIDFRALPGEVVAVVGATGAGKTTLLRVLLGLERAEAGEARYDGKRLVGPVGPAARPFAWVPQDAPVVLGTLDENVRLGAEGADARAVFCELGASDVADAIGGERIGPGGRPLSGGERRLVALARALATELPVLLLDEPTVGLDAEARQRVLGAVSRLRGKRTVLLVTHDPEAAAIADRVVELGGRPSGVLRAASSGRE
jgi:ABC-type transport system involved in cytochrome bd biosynthesis fused ATPase/permease subunit